MKREPAADILERLKSGYFLPSLSVVAMRLVELASSDSSSVGDLAGLIERDPSLTVRLLKLANSALLRTSDPVTSIEEAIFRIGFNRLRIMALSLSLRDTFPMGRRGPMDYEKFWKVSLYKALLSKSLALRLSTCNPDEAFVAGLVQEIGLLILFDLFIKGKDETVSLDLYPLEPLLSLERERYGVHHREIGDAALRYWHFPESIVACQQCTTPEVKADPLSPLCLTCEMARELSSVICQESMGLNRMFTSVEKIYGLDYEAVSDIIVTVFGEVEEVARSLNVELNKEKDLLEVMEKANRTLARLSEKIALEGDSSPPKALPTFGSLAEGKSEPTADHTLLAVYHEIRNPLTSVGGFVKRLSRTMDPSSTGWEYVQIILEETQKLEQALSHMTRKSA